MATDFSIRHAAHIIRLGGVIAYPTDTIYGLGCNPFDHDAVERINHIKQRPQNKYFVLLAGDIEQVEKLLDIKPAQKQTLLSNTEPTSWVVPASSSAPHWLVDNNNELTIRISDKPEVKQLCHMLGYPLISTSANISGKAPARNSLELHRYFHQKVDKILLSRTEMAGKASKIIRLCDNQVIRK